MQNLPSKKVFIVVVIATLILVASIAISKDEGLKNVSDEQNLEIIAQTESKLTDSDGDGLEDWKEELFETDKNNPDSDGDGVLDGEQFASKKIYPEITPISLYEQYGLQGDSTKEAGSNTDGNVTQSLYSNAVNSYASLGEEGLTSDAEKSLIDSLSSTVVLPSKINPYSIYDAQITTETTVEILDQYLLDFLEVLSNNADAYNSDPLELINSWDETKDPNILTELLSIQRSYEILANDFMQTTVPFDMVENHIDIANNFYNTSIILKDISEIDIDPVKSMLGGATYAQYRTERSDLIIDFTEHFDYFRDIYSTE